MQLNSNLVVSAILLCLSFNLISAKICVGSSDGLSHSHANNPKLRYETYVAMYTNCTVVSYNLEIVFLDQDFNMEFLSTIQEIMGYVLVVGNRVNTLPLHQLRLVRGRYLYDAGGQSSKKSIFIENNYALKEIQFDSLTEIVHGDVYIIKNKELCFLNTIDWNDIHSDPNKNILVNVSNSCDVCSSNCSVDGIPRCWGKNHCQTLHKKGCSKNCEWGCFGSEPTQCCDEQCAAGCDASKMGCWACRYFWDNGSCVKECPPEQIYNFQTFKKEKSTDCDSALIPMLCVHG